MTPFDTRICKLGEGPLWHPERRELFWFDIMGRTLYSKTNSWSFDDYVSAAGWVDRDTLIMATSKALVRLDLITGASTHLCDLEADNPVTRSNDGRADAHGGFWIGTMGINAEPDAGAIYRYYRGELRQLVNNITISNAICFSPDGLTAYYCDTTTSIIMQQSLDPDEGWPVGAPTVFTDLSRDAINPDGAVVDADGYLWNAQWGLGRVARYAPDGTFDRAIDVPAKQASCPAFGGDDFGTLFCTTAQVGLTNAPAAGQTFYTETDIKGQPEHRVLL